MPLEKETNFNYTENYIKARLDLIQAIVSFNELTQQQKECLIREILEASSAVLIFDLLKRLFK